jgi:hypothetical protein
MRLRHCPAGVGDSKVRASARPRRQRRAQHESPCREHQLQRRAKACARVPSVHLRSFGRLLGGGGPVALYLDQAAGVGVGATLRGGAEVDERRLARLRVTPAFCVARALLGLAAADVQTIRVGVQSEAIGCWRVGADPSLAAAVSALGKPSTCNGLSSRAAGGRSRRTRDRPPRQRARRRGLTLRSAVRASRARP